MPSTIHSIERSEPADKPESRRPPSTADTALQYSISPNEYRALHKYIISRSPLKKRAYTVEDYQAVIKSRDDFTPAAIRASIRLFLASQAGLKAWDLIKSKVIMRGKVQAPVQKLPLLKSPNFRLSVSLSTLLLFHRLLYRFFSLLRHNLLQSDAKPFRTRNPRISRLLVSRLAPAIGASLAGFTLGVYPSDQLRITIAIYVFSRSIEFFYNKLDDEGWMNWKPWWLGSWLLFPLSLGQLFHAATFDRDCVSMGPFQNFFMNHSDGYVQKRPDQYPENLPWPSQWDILDSLATVAKLRYPPFSSPILFPDSKTLPASLSLIAPIVEPAHPAINQLSCAILHPKDPSCLRSYLTFYINAFPGIARSFTIIFTLFSLPRYKKFLSDPLVSVEGLAKRILRVSLFISGTIGSTWGAVCLFQRLLPRKTLPEARFFLSGFIGGLWAFMERGTGRSNFLYVSRMSIDSSWKVARKHKLVKGGYSGDVFLFVASFALVNAVYETSPAAVSGGVIRKGLRYIRGEGFTDIVLAGKKKDAAVEEKKE